MASESADDRLPDPEYVAMQTTEIIDRIGERARAEHLDTVMAAHKGPFVPLETRLWRARRGRIDLEEYNVVTFSNEFPSGYCSVHKAIR